MMPGGLIIMNAESSGFSCLFCIRRRQKAQNFPPSQKLQIELISAIYGGRKPKRQMMFARLSKTTRRQAV